VLGLATRLAAIPLLVIMAVALATTKQQVYQDSGFWELMHGSRTDFSMIMGSLFLLIKGGGRWSVDRIIFPDKRKTYWR
jgi:putative oxidoreductase